MMKFLRSQSQLVLIIVLGVIGLGFLFYGNSGSLLTSGGGHGSSDYGRIDGEDISVAELYASVRNTRNALIIGGRAQQLNQPGARAQIAQEAWRQLLLEHEAERLHIQIGDQELADFIRSQPIFQKDGVYSPEAYRKQMAQIQLLLRIESDPGADQLRTASETFATIMRNSLRANAVYNALFSTVRASTKDLSSQYEKFYGPADVSVINFAAKDFEDKVQVSPEEVAAEYKNHPLNPDYRTKEKRNVDYIVLSLTPEQSKLPPQEKAAAIQALGEKALDFVLAFQPEPTANSNTPPPLPDFYAEAKKRGFTPVTTGFFTEDVAPSGLPPSHSFNDAAFSLSKDNVISKVVEMDNGVAVLHLAEIQASELLPLDQVKADITKAIRQGKAVQAEETAAQSAAQALKTALAKGTDFKAAAASLNLKVETLPSFVPMKVPAAEQRLQTIAYATTALAPGQVSEPAPIQSDDSTVLVHLNSRAKADPAGFEAFATRFGEQQNQQLRSLVFIDWANWASKQPGTHKPPELDAYGSVE